MTNPAMTDTIRRCNTLPKSAYTLIGSDLEHFPEDVDKVLLEKDTYDTFDASLYVYNITDPEEHREALKEFKRFYGDDFFQCIQQNKAAITDTDNRGMAFALFDPLERAVFVLNKLGGVGIEGAKIFFDQACRILRIEQKDSSDPSQNVGPFKNAGEYFYSLMNQAQKQD